MCAPYRGYVTPPKKPITLLVDIQYVFSQQPHPVRSLTPKGLVHEILPATSLSSLLLISTFSFADNVPDIVVTGTGDNPSAEGDTYAWKLEMANQYYAQQAARQNAAGEAANAQAKKEAEAHKAYQTCISIAEVNKAFCMNTLAKNNVDAVYFCNNLSVGMSVATINPLLSGLVEATTASCRSTRAANYEKYKTDCSLDFSLSELKCSDKL